MTRQRSSNALEMHARALYANGKRTEAIEAQKQAIAISNEPDDLPELKRFLTLFERGE